MKNEMHDKCSWIGCKKEVLEEGYKFCGEHERKYSNFKSNIGKGTVAVTSILVVSIVKPLLSNQKKK